MGTSKKSALKPAFFATPAAFRAWLEKNHGKAAELLVGFYKTTSGKPSITWPESVEQALCFGWIDGVRKRIDDESYTIRFTPRKRGSNWSAINIAKVEELKKLGLMQPAGLAAYEARSEDKSRIYSYETRPRELPPQYEQEFRKNAKAWEFFNAQPPGYRRTIIFYIVDAKREETRAARLGKVIAASAAGKRL